MQEIGYELRFVTGVNLWYYMKQRKDQSIMGAISIGAIHSVPVVQSPVCVASCLSLLPRTLWPPGRWHEMRYERAEYFQAWVLCIVLQYVLWPSLCSYALKFTQHFWRTVRFILRIHRIFVLQAANCDLASCCLSSRALRGNESVFSCQELVCTGPPKYHHDNCTNCRYIFPWQN